MSEVTYSEDFIAKEMREKHHNTPLKRFLWALVQPLIVFGGMISVALAIQHSVMQPDALRAGADTLTGLLLFMPLIVIWIAERLWTRRKDWLLNYKEYVEDCFWMFTGAFIWVPLFSDYYHTPIKDAFEWVRDNSFIPVTLESSSILGLILCAIFARTMGEFIYYWLHRLQHVSLTFWRIHATHHHIVKMSAARSDRTHPLEYLALGFSTGIILALFGASQEVIAVTAAFSFAGGWMNHANLPLRPGIYGWFFTAAEHHHTHHSRELSQSNCNYGCNVIIWDRIFGTFCDASTIRGVGAGKGVALPLWKQYALSFMSNKQLKEL